MSELSAGKWQPWDIDGGRHVCGKQRQTAKHNPNLSQSPLKETSAETYLTRCPWCRDHVYYHTNGNGDTVYFDSLGWPWQVHPCWKRHWGAQQKRKRFLKQLQNQDDCIQQQRLMLLGTLQKNARSAQHQSGLFTVKEETLANWMGLSLKQLRHDYGRLYRASKAGIAIVDVADIRQLNKHKIVAVIPSSAPQEQQQSVKKITKDGFEWVQCSCCREWKIIDLIEVHLVACREKRYRDQCFRNSVPGSKRARQTLFMKRPSKKHKRQRPGKQERDLLKALREEGARSITHPDKLS